VWRLDALLMNVDRTARNTNMLMWAGPIAKLEPAARFRWLTAKRSTVIQSSNVHPGRCTDPDATLERLYRQMVLVDK